MGDEVVRAGALSGEEGGPVARAGAGREGEQERVGVAAAGDNLVDQAGAFRRSGGGHCRGVRDGRRGDGDEAQRQRGRRRNGAELVCPGEQATRHGRHYNALRPFFPNFVSPPAIIFCSLPGGEAPDAPLQTGLQCRHCPALKTCPAVAARIKKGNAEFFERLLKQAK